MAFGVVGSDGWGLGNWVGTGAVARLQYCGHTRRGSEPGPPRQLLRMIPWVSEPGPLRARTYPARSRWMKLHEYLPHRWSGHGLVQAHRRHARHTHTSRHERKRGFTPGACCVLGLCTRAGHGYAGGMCQVAVGRGFRHRPSVVLWRAAPSSKCRGLHCCISNQVPARVPVAVAAVAAWRRGAAVADQIGAWALRRSSRLKSCR